MASATARPPALRAAPSRRHRGHGCRAPRAVQAVPLADVALGVPEGYGQYLLSLTPLFVYALYRQLGASAVTARASHILVEEEAVAQELKQRLASDSATFEELAQEFSTCPSGRKGGDLGTFKPGQMVRPFSDVVFNDELGVVHGPVKTQFGHHLILITERSDAEGQQAS